MIHKHVSMRDLLRDPKKSFPQEGESTIVTSNGFPAFQINRIANVSFMSSTVGPGVQSQVTIEKDSATGEVKIQQVHEHKK